MNTIYARWGVNIHMWEDKRVQELYEYAQKKCDSNKVNGNAYNAYFNIHSLCTPYHSMFYVMQALKALCDNPTVKYSRKNIYRRVLIQIAEKDIQV